MCGALSSVLGGMAQALEINFSAVLGVVYTLIPLKVPGRISSHAVHQLFSSEASDSQQLPSKDIHHYTGFF
jgi:hypothetical protein